ncbi:MAG: magnesium transporter [Bacteroidetes bacterium]|nr:magnesium transporter [Bacteroidota bacterium]
MASQVTFYLSRVIGRKCFDGNGKIIGILKDLLIEYRDYVHPEGEPVRPKVFGAQIKFHGKDRYLDFNKTEIIKSYGQYKIILHNQAELPEQIVNHSIFLVDNVLDKQIVDINGKKLVRVNDVRLVSVSSGIYAIAVDVGMEGLLRRIGIATPIKGILKPFNANLPNKFILWDEIATVDLGHSGLKLSKTFSKLHTLHPSDVADIIEELGKASGPTVFAALDEEHAADVLEELEPHAQVHIIESLPVEKAADVLEKMPADEVADIIDELEEEKAEQLLKEMDRESSEEVRELLEYSDKVVGSIMTTEFLAFNLNSTVDETIRILRKEKPEANTIYSLFVVDNNDRFISVVSLRELVISEPQTILAEIMKKNPITIFDNDKLDSLAEIVSKYNLLAVPVINEERKLEGMVVIDDIVEDLLNKKKTK